MDNIPMGPPTHVQTRVRVSSSPIRFIWRADSKCALFVPQFFERGPLRRAGARKAVLAVAGRASHRRVPDAAARAPATPAASGARV